MAAAFDYNAEHAKMTAYVNLITMQYQDCIFEIAHYLKARGNVEYYEFHKAIIIANPKNNIIGESYGSSIEIINDTVNKIFTDPTFKTVKLATLLFVDTANYLSYMNTYKRPLLMLIPSLLATVLGIYQFNISYENDTYTITEKDIKPSFDVALGDPAFMQSLIKDTKH